MLRSATCGVLAVLQGAAVSQALGAEGDALDRSRLHPTFAEEFSGPLSLFDRTSGSGRWKTNYDFGSQDSGPSSRTLGAELQVYSDRSYNGVEPFAVQNGELVISAARNPKPDAAENAGKAFTSGLMTTSPSFRQTYGYFEMRAALPQGAGLWPAFWLNGPFDPAITAPQYQGEIDVVEMLGKDPSRIYCSAHWPKDETHLSQAWKTFDVAVGSTAASKVYGVLWLKDALVWYVDDKEVARMQNPGLHSPLYMLVDLAVGGEWGGLPNAGTTFPAEMRIDYIRAYSVAD